MKIVWGVGESFAILHQYLNSDKVSCMLVYILIIVLSDMANNNHEQMLTEYTDLGVQLNELDNNRDGVLHLRGKIITALMDVEGENDLTQRLIDQLRVLDGVLFQYKNTRELCQIKRNILALKLFGL